MSSNGSYPEPEGWGDDGFWADSGIDADYETGLTGAVRPPADPAQAPGYSYWSDDAGWQSSPGAYAGGPLGPFPGDVPGDPARLDYPGAGGDAAYGAAAYGTAAYGAAPPWDAGGPAGPAGPGGPGGPGGPADPDARGPGRSHGPGGGPGGPGRTGKRKKKWWQPTWKKALAVVGAGLVVFVLALVGVYYYLSSSAKIPAAITDANYQNTTVYYADGKTPIGTIGEYNRHDLNFSQIPVSLQNAVLAAEDRSFWTEGGISPTGIIRAAYDDLMSSGGNLSGGSTITQEFVKNYYDGIGTEQTASRKVKEVFIAQKLAKTESKQWILQHYLNLIYLGDQSYGVYAAAQTYFGEPVSKLTVAQDAVIAAIIQQPSTYPLPSYRKNLIARWHYVIDGLVKMNKLTAAQASRTKFPKLLTDSASGSGSQTSYSTSSKDPWAPYVMDVVYNELTGVDHVPTSALETGGLKVVTTISRSKEVAMYKAVNNEFATIKAQGDTIPSYVLTGAELQKPSDGEILAIYPGPGQNLSKAKCEIYHCDLNTAIYTREQVGSSFKPYVLSAAVKQGMNVQTSILNANPYLWVPPDTEPLTLSVTSATKAGPGYFAVENDGGEIIGNAKQGGGTSVQNALAQSSNTAFTDLAHRVTTSSIIEMASDYGVNIAETAKSGSNLDQMVGQVGLALGTASLTVNEQTTMLSTIDDNGLYHAAHLIKYWQEPFGRQTKPSVDTHQVLTPAQDSQVQYAMEMTTVDGTGTAAAYGLGARPIIAKTGTTSGSLSGFFIGAIPQYSLVVGMFTAKQGSTTQSLIPLGGGGFGGARPAEIWNAFAQAEFNQLPVEDFPSPVFSGQKWNQVGKLPKKKKKVKKPTCPTAVHGKHAQAAVGAKPQPSACPSPTPTPTPTHTVRRPPTHSPTASPTPSPSLSPTATPTPTPTPTPTATATPTATPTSTATGGVGPGRGGAPGGGAARAATGVRTGLAVGGALAVLPGSLLWTTMAARKRRRRRAGTVGLPGPGAVG